MRFGVHVSIAGGIEKGLLRAVELGCDTAQMFLVNPRGWSATPLDEGMVERFLEVRRTTAKEVYPLVVHIPYLPNLAAKDPVIFKKSVVMLRDQLDRCQRLGIDFLVTHLGKGEGEVAIPRMVEAIQRAYDDKPCSTRLLLENTAGQGREIGNQVSELAELYEKIQDFILKGICLDTCHAFAAGYEMAASLGLKRLIREFKQSIGFKEVKLLHLNDSKKPLGSHVDRHARIGEGFIGEAGFETLFHHPQLRSLPGILEVPRNTDEDDRNQLALVRKLAAGKAK